MNKQPRKLFTVVDTFMISGRGLIAEEGPPFDTFGTDGRTHSSLVEIRCPDGSVLISQASFYMAHFQPLEAQRKYIERGCYMCMFKNLAKVDVPVGSEVWEVEPNN
jgi:hypothetical protein